MGKTNVQALTISVGNFIREVRQGNHRPSMYAILLKNGVNSATRAKSLVADMVENKIIIQHKDGSYSLTKVNYDSVEVMRVLLAPKPRKVKAVPEESPLSRFSAQDLVAELRRRGYEVTAKKQVVVVEEL